ncbi:DUF839 domain-containing protein [Rhizobacter sp. J219]|uniref:PhoX family protein n=1 Tax=Rhizobacter sp. J219 TaxID=2898430 RepID=UPI002151D6F1|nr:alkaline phosphatase PhoX [Rhizobacter sp. J219]MCR5881902.1 DUF839 domain-containing protein [Rhizobacter sp. J219]
MQDLNRRNFLSFVGGTGVAVSTVSLGGLMSAEAVHAAPVPVSFTPVRVPFPLPIFTTNTNFLPTGVNGAGTLLAPTETGGPAAELPSYTVIDDVVVPPEYERYVISAWGDRPFADANQYVGFNADYTGYVPLSGTNEGLLWTNHEYVSYPFSEICPESAITTPAGNNVFERVIGFPIPTTKTREYMGECLYNVGGSLLRIRRVARGGRFGVVNGHADNRRLHGLSGLAINAMRTDAYYTGARGTVAYSEVTAWGPRAHQAGDSHYLEGTGPAATEVFPLSSDTLGNRIIGTLGNCSGGTTPWGTILSCEENFQADASAFYLGVTEGVRANGTQTGYIASGTQTDTGNRTAGAEFGLVGEKYGWVVEIDVKNPAVRAKKHSWLGRFRHENVALKVQAGQRLAAYMGDDRRGGHVWKFVSSGVVGNVTSPANSALFESGTLYVARFNADGTGTWIPLLLSTPTNPNVPSAISSVQFASEGVRDRNGLVNLPRRVGVAGQTVEGGFFACTTLNEATALPDYIGRTLADFYTSQGAVLCDAFAAANLVGGTPAARPEDVEVHPKTGEIFIAFTDGAAGSDGYADSRIFTVSKYSTAINTEQQSGGLYKIVEAGNDPAATSFTWSRFLQGGEAGAAHGAGFANLDNLAFDAKANVWGVMDMSTNLHNGIGLGTSATPTTINHALSGSGNAANLVGVYGNNWMFCIPTEGPDAGKQLPFAIGPMRAELTGPTFIGDHLILAVQHPGENAPIDAQNTGPRTRTIEMLTLDGTGVFNQTRTVPLGCQWPSNTAAGNTSGIPKSAVIGIRRRNGGSFI